MDSNANLYYLFRRCLNADYVHAKSGADYAVTRTGKTLYVFFEWSDGCLDWKNNLDFPAKAHGRGGEAWFVHRGFLRVFESVRNEITVKVQNELKKADRIVCVGYSHGAALAGLCVEELQFQFGKEIKISGYGFGCPRFIFGRLPAAVRARFASFVPIRNVPDIVTHLPPVLLGYSHPSKLKKIGKLGKYTPVSAHYPKSYLDETKNEAHVAK